MSDWMLRRSLLDLVLTGPRLAVRTFILRCHLVLTAICFVLFCVEQHHTAGRDWHSLAIELNGTPLLGTAALFGMSMWALRRPALWNGLITGVLSIVGGIVGVGALVLVHLLSSVQHNGPGELLVFALLALAALGLIVFIVEWIVRIRERDHLESSDPVFATARVVSR